MFREGLIPDPYPPTGPDEGVLQDWYNDLIGSAQELEDLGNRLLAAAIDPQAWYGHAADNFRQSASTVAFSLVGLAQGMQVVAGALLDYLSAGQDWDHDFAAAKSLDHEGVMHDYGVQNRLIAAMREEKWPDQNFFRAAQYPEIWQHVAAYAGQVTPPSDIQLYDSPQKKQAVSDLNDALDVLATAGLLAASKVQAVCDEMLTKVDSHGGTSATTDPLVGLAALGVTAVRNGSDDLSLGSDAPHEGHTEVDEEAAGGLASLEPVLASYDSANGTREIRGGALELAQGELALDGSEGSAAALAAGEHDAGILVGAKGATAFGTAEASEITGDDGAPGAGRATLTRVAKVGGGVIGVLSIVSDVNTLEHNEDTGAHGAVTATAATLNAAAAGTEVLTTTAGLAGATVEIPGLDIITGGVFVVTGIYALGNAIFHGDHPAHRELP